jgi:hypothetical protein
LVQQDDQLVRSVQIYSHEGDVLPHHRTPCRHVEESPAEAIGAHVVVHFDKTAGQCGAAEALARTLANTTAHGEQLLNQCDPKVIGTTAEGLRCLTPLAVCS